ARGQVEPDAEVPVGVRRRQELLGVGGAVGRVALRGVRARTLQGALNRQATVGRPVREVPRLEAVAEDEASRSCWRGAGLGRIGTLAAAVKRADDVVVRRCVNRSGVGVAVGGQGARGADGGVRTTSYR